MYIDRRTDAEWAADIVSAFPKSWQDGLLSSWAKEHDDDRRTGNLGLLERVRTLADSARGGISPDGKRWIACKPGFFPMCGGLCVCGRRRSTASNS